MGITDKVSGRLKKAAGDLTGNEDLRRQGAQQERKADAELELAEREARLRAEEERVEAAREEAEVRASAAARREFAKAEREIGAEERRLAAEREATRAKAQEYDELDRRTDPARLAEESTREELYERAQELDVKGRSDMSKEELAEEIVARS